MNNSDYKVEINEKKNVKLLFSENELTNKKKDFLIKQKSAGLDIVEFGELIESEFEKVSINNVGKDWFVRALSMETKQHDRLIKSIDILLALFLLIIFFPFAFILSLSLKIKSKGPIFFLQERNGLYMKPFTLIKFRTMDLSKKSDDILFADKQGKRINIIGKFMRKFRIDEIPQLINVLKGDMNMVGPRPERDIIVKKLTEKIPEYSIRSIIKPGLTGWAQVNCGYAGEKLENHVEKLEYDLFYIKNRNVFLNILVLFKTIKTILYAKGE